MRKTFNEINITPLTDIFLVLLIIMMVVAPLLDQQGISLSVPENVEAEKIEKEPLILTVYVSAAGPGKVTGLTIQVTSHPMAELTWDEIDCDGFKVYRDDKAIARVEAGPEDDVVIFTILFPISTAVSTSSKRLASFSAFFAFLLP